MTAISQPQAKQDMTAIPGRGHTRSCILDDMRNRYSEIISQKLTQRYRLCNLTPRLWFQTLSPKPVNLRFIASPQYFEFPSRVTSPCEYQ